MKRWFPQFGSLFQKSRSARLRAHRCESPRWGRVGLEPLEERCLLSAGTVFQQTNLVSDLPGIALIQDPNLVNPWGISLSPTGGAFWVSDNAKGVTTLYTGDVNGSPFIKSAALPVVFGLGAPTGQVFNTTQDFRISGGGNTLPAVFIFASEDGQITAWNPNVPPPAPSTQAQPEVNIPDAIFKGLALANNTIGTHQGNFLYATDFHNGKIDVFDKDFHLTAMDGAFTDSKLPMGYAPFGIRAINGKLYVTYAKQDQDKHDDAAGAGHGFVDVFDTDGHLLQRLASQGPLNSPWGLALAPADFGKFSNDLLVGNFGDGHISAFDPTSGAFLGQLRNTDGQPVAVPGLWGIVFGNGVSAGDKNTLYFSSGPGHEQHGLFGSLKLANLGVIATSANVNGVATVNVFDAATHVLKFTITPFGDHFHHDVRVAVGDVTGDGLPDIIVGTGPGATTEVRVFDGRTGQALPGRLGDLDPFGSRTGLFVAAGDVNGDGHDDIIVSLDSGGMPLVKVYSGTNGMLVTRFMAEMPQFRGGIRVASADVNGDGKADIITSDGPGGSPTVNVFSGANGSLLKSFLGGPANFHGGIFVAAGDANGDGTADIVVGLDAGSAPTVNVFSGKDFSSLGTFTAGSTDFAGGVRVGTVTINGKTAIVTGSGPGGSPQVQVFDGTTFQPVQSFFATDPNFSGGVFVGGFHS